MTASYDPQADTPTSDVLCTKDNRAGLVTLSRPRALNALTLEMVQAMDAHFLDCAKDPHIYGIVQRAHDDGAFCAGGDVKAIYHARDTDPAAGFRFYRKEYQHNWTLQRFIKPTVSLINGVCMGGGCGISVHGTHRIAGAGFKLAMPETAIGLFPDIGASYFLPRLPGRIGLYMGLTGAVIGPADCYRLRLVTHCIAADRFDEIEAAMREGEPIDPLLDALHEDPGEGELSLLHEAIDRCFAARSVEQIVARLEAEDGKTRDWAQNALAALRSSSPTSLKLTHRLLAEGARAQSLKASLKLEFRCAVRCLRAHDHYEGVRAKMVDKDNAPQWRPARLEDVSDAAIEAYLAPLDDLPELELADHWTLID